MSEASAENALSKTSRSSEDVPTIQLHPLDRGGDGDGGEQTVDGGNIDDNSKTSKQVHLYRISRQACLIAVWLGMGLFLQITGPCLPDLRARLNVSYREISRALAMKSVGNILGATGGGLLCDLLWRHVDCIIAAALVGAAAETAMAPWTGSLELFGAMLFLQGLSEGIISAGGNAMCLGLWGVKAAAPLQSLHFGFGLGGILAPQIARPFLSPLATFGNTGDSNRTTLTVGGHDDMDEQTWRPSKIEHAFLVPAIYTLLLAFVVLGFYIKKAPANFKFYRTTHKMTSRMLSPESCAPGKPTFSVLMFVALFFFYLHAAGGERVVAKFLVAFLTEKKGLAFTIHDASNLNSAFWASFTAGRGISILVLRWLPPKWLMAICILLTNITYTTLAIFGNNNETVMWISIPLIGFFTGPLFPAGFGWANRYLNMNCFAVSILLVGSGAGGFIYQFVGGYVIPGYFLYLLCGCGVGVAVCFALLEGLVYGHTDRFGEEKDCSSNHDDRIHPGAEGCSEGISNEDTRT